MVWFLLPRCIPYWIRKKENAAIPGDYSVLVRLSGFEPLAFRLGGGRSILLSYRRML